MRGWIEVVPQALFLSVILCQWVNRPKRWRSWVGIVLGFVRVLFLAMKGSPAHDAAYWIEKLQLEKHPEGGYFRQTYRAERMIAREALPAEFSGDRAASTAIYFLLEGKNFSAFHRLRSDEVWHFYSGSPLVVHVIDPAGSYSSLHLGSDAEVGQLFQGVVPAGSWFASHVADWTSWALVGCTVAPGFDFADFEMGKREELAREYPQHRELVHRLTRA